MKRILVADRLGLSILSWGFLLLLGAVGFAHADEYSGWYICSQGKTSLNLSIKRSGTIAEGVFHFDTGNKTGSFKMSGDYNPANQTIELKGTEWINQPSGFELVDLSGKFENDDTIIKGTVNHPSCTIFEVKRFNSSPTGSILNTPASPEDVAMDEFNRAKQDAYNTISTEPLSKYLLGNKRSKFTGEAKAIIAEISDYIKANKKGRKELIQFIKKYPSSQYTNDVQLKVKKMDALEEMKKSLSKTITWQETFKQDTDDCVTLYFFKKCAWVTYTFNVSGKVEEIDTENETYSVSVSDATLVKPSAISMKYLQFQGQATSSFKEGAIGKTVKVKHESLIKKP